jgi:ferritin
MLSKKAEASLNKQMNNEFFNSHLYLSMGAWFESQNLFGFAHWMKVQAEEERGHAIRFYKQIGDRRGRIAVGAVDAPPVEWKSPLAAFEAAYAHEAKVSAAVNAMIDAAAAEKDHATVNFLQWFVSEQVEEEAQTDEIVQQLKMAGDSKGALMQIDHHLGKRGKS